MPDLSDRLEDMTSEPAAATVDGQSATNQPIPDVIEADRYLAGKEALTGTNANGGKRSAWGCVRMAKGVPPGAA